MTQTFTRRSTPELRKMINELIEAKERWKTVRKQSVLLHGEQSLIIKNLDKTIHIHNSRISDIMDILAARLKKANTKKKKPKVK